MNILGMTDPGHGGFDPGACGNGLRECDLTWRFGIKFTAIMERCGVTMYYTREQNKTATNNQIAELGYRCQLANQKGVSFYISFHTNSGGGTGFESYRYTGNEPATVRLQQCVHRNVAAIFTSTGMPDRGMKTVDFAVLRGTNMPAILLELGFIDNARDAKYINDDAFQNKVAEAVSKGVCEWLGISYVPATPPAPKKYELYYAGCLESLFTDRAEAYNYGWIAYNDAGHKDVYLISPDGSKYVFDQHPEENPKKPSPNPVDETPILGDAIATAEQLFGYAKTVNPEFPDSLPAMYLEIGKWYGIRGDIAFGQMLYETNYFRFGKDVQQNQNNFAGIGAVGGGAVGASFTTIDEGIRAHIQHLYGYASTGPIPEGEPLVDPRFNLLTRGSVQTWEGLNGHWAVPGTTYGQDILTIYKKLSEYVVPVDPLDEAKDNGFLIGDPNQPITAGNVAILLNQLFHKLGGK